MAVGQSVEAADWAAEADRLLDRMAGRFARVETRRRARSFVFGLLADLPRKNCWSIAEHAGDPDPHGMQHFLARASWDTDGVREDLRDYVIGALGDTDGILVVDETGDLKKGVHTVGVQRQYTGTAGRIENAQVAVYLVYAGPRGHAMIDRELYLPDPGPTTPTVDAAGGTTDIEFATKPALAAGMLVRALAAEVPARWVTGDEVYGADPAACRVGGQPARVRAGDRLRPPHPDRRRSDPRRRVGRRAAAACLAPALGRFRGEGPALLRLGLDRAHRPRSPRRSARHPVVVAADPPPPRHR